MEMKLVYYDLNSELQEFRIEKNYITVGRKEDNDIVLKDIFVSRYHCNLIEDQNTFYILDKGSKYGTLLNGEQIEKAPLKPGDQIKIGNIIVHFLAAEESLKKWAESGNDRLGFNLDDDLEFILSSLSEGEDDLNSEMLKELLNKIKVKQIEYGKKLRNYQIMYRVGTMINSIFDFDILIKMILDLALEVTEGDRGYIIIRDTETKEDKILFHKNIDNPSAFLSKTMIAKLVKDKIPFIINESDLTSSGYGESARASNISSAMLSPLLNKNMDFVGAIYIDRNKRFTSFSDSDLDLMKIFSSYVSISIENSQLFAKVRKEEHIKNNLKRYLSSSIVDTVSLEADLKLGGHEEDISIMFIDIRNFTPLSEKLSPDEVVSLLNGFFNFTAEYIFKYKGTLDKFIGDCVMTIYGAPIKDEDHADNAVKTALEIRDYFLKDFRKQIKKDFKLDIDIGIGINSGPAIVGNIGTDDRMDYTAISDTVNTAERIESKSRDGAVYISRATRSRLKCKYKIISKGEMTLKGKAEPQEVFEVIKK